MEEKKSAEKVAKKMKAKNGKTLLK
jgi:hypothetical protein